MEVPFKERLLIEMLNWPPWITAPANSDAMMINMRTNKVSGIEVDHSAKRHSVELCFGVCVFVFLAFDEFLPWRNISNAWTALSRSHDLKGTTKLRVLFIHHWLGKRSWKAGKPILLFSLVKNFVCGLWLVGQCFSLVTKIVRPIRFFLVIDGPFLFDTFV